MVVMKRLLRDVMDMMVHVLLLLHKLLLVLMEDVLVVEMMRLEMQLVRDGTIDIEVACTWLVPGLSLVNKGL